MSGSAKKTIYAAMGANFAIAVVKFIAASMTGSSAILLEKIHSLTLPRQRRGIFHHFFVRN
jgi:divalent metal cation (Fe/Co/Zn/Cd) transporter